MRGAKGTTMRLAVWVVFLAVGGIASGGDAQLEQWYQSQVDDLEQLYRRFHRAPELSFHEEETAKRFAEELRNAGLTVTTGVGGFGVVGVLENGKGPTLLFRADLDGLPVTEETGLEYASKMRTKDDSGKEVGTMHACGHDIHMTSLIATARYLAKHPSEWRGKIVFVGQPAEERGGGAQAMLADGLYVRFGRPDFALALHVDAFLESTKVAYRAGYAMANTDSCDITVRGRGGHGSLPQGCIDPIVQAALLITDLQTIVSREINPLEPAVVTVGSIHGGTKHNIIPNECRLQLTLRSYTPEVREHLKQAVVRKAKAIAESSRAPAPVVEFSEGTPAVFNDGELVAKVVPGFRKVLGDENIIEAEQSMGGEDFSRFAEGGIPVFMFRLGSVAKERLEGLKAKGEQIPSLHSAGYFPEPRATLRTGLLATVAAVREILPTK